MDRVEGFLPTCITEAAQKIPSLTPRQQEVIVLLAKGYSNRRMAVTMGIAESTVKQYVTEIMKFLQLESRVQIALAGYINSHGHAGTRADEP